MADHFDQAFTDLQGDITDEAIADDHVHLAAINIPALDVADEVEAERLHQRPGGPGDLVPLVVLLADGENADARLGTSQDDARVNLAHHGELREHARRAVDVSADVHDHHGRALHDG